MEGENNGKIINVLYIDDEVHNLQAFKASFRRDFNVFTADSAQKALEVLKDYEVHVIISDQRMPQMTGIEFFESLIPLYPWPIRMLLTGYADINAVIDAINKGEVYKYFTKPWNEEDLRKNIISGFDIYTERKEKHALTETLVDINKKLEFLLRQKLIS
jgi:response regulator RpfG family c-di-GMP phosphodiesterase